MIVSYVPPRVSSGDLRVVVADGHELYRLGVREALRGGSEVVFAGEVGSWGELLECDWLGVDMVLVEVGLPGGELLAGIKRLKSLAPSLAVVILATGSETGLLQRAFEAGAAGWISKDVGAEGFGHAMQRICEFGDADIVFEPQHEDEDFERVDLTKRELEVLRLVADGSTNADVAQRLWVSERTIKFHLSNIYEKLGVQNRTAACRWAEAHGLLSPVDGPHPLMVDRAA